VSLTVVRQMGQDRLVLYQTVIQGLQKVCPQSRTSFWGKWENSSRQMGHMMALNFLALTCRSMRLNLCLHAPYACFSLCVYTQEKTIKLKVNNTK